MSSFNGTLKLRGGKLHVFKQPKSKNFFWRTFLNGKYAVHTTKTDNLALAKSIAETEYDRLRSDRITPDGKPAHSWEECEQGLLTSLLVDEGSRPSRIKTYKVKLGILRQFFTSHPIHSIKAKTIEDYINWRKTSFKPFRLNFHHSTVTNKTLSADLLTLRQALKYAKREEWIATIPDFPKLTITPRAGGWFSQKEWKQLWQFSQRWTRQSTNVEEREARQYAHDYMLWLVHTGMRVDEALKVRYEDVHEVHRKLPESVSEEDYFYVWVKGGKLSYLKRPTEMIGLYGAVRAFDRLKARNPEAKPKDLLFPVNPATTIRQLLHAAGLLVDERGERRTAKSFRHTYIMFRLLANVDVYSLAQNCRTSVKMIQMHYGSYLNARMKRVELTKFLPRQDSDQRKERHDE